MRIELFEDQRVWQLDPVTLGRAAYSIQCGSRCLADWISKLGAPVRGHVRPHLSSWQAANYASYSSTDLGSTPRMLVNARLVPCESTFAVLRQLRDAARPGLVFQGESLAAAFVPAESPELPAPYDDEQLTSFLDHPLVARLPKLEHHLHLLNYPHDLICRHVQTLGENLNHRLSTGHYHEVRDGVFVADDVQLPVYFDTDTQHGPIVIEDGVVVRSFACLRGPLFLDRMSRVNEHAVLRPGVSVGPMSKVGGEIEASVIEGYSNKQHHGYLGHSYLGQWVNLGAGTCNSNLKNTYGTVRMMVRERKIDTGMQFMGCVIGDFTKSAINTSIFTGKLIGSCSMLYGFVTTDVPSFVNYARSFGELTDLSAAVIAQTQQRSFLRRGIQQQPWHIQLIDDMYGIVSAGRQLAEGPVSL